MSTEEKYQKLLEFVKDLSENGTRHDTNPTMRWNINDPLSIGMGYVEYIQSMDKSIRERAQNILDSF